MSRRIASLLLRSGQEGTSDITDNEKLDLIDGDEVRLIYRGNGSYSVQLMRQPRSGTDVVLLNGARPAPIADVLDYLKQAL